MTNDLEIRYIEIFREILHDKWKKEYLSGCLSKAKLTAKIHDYVNDYLIHLSIGIEKL